MNEQGKALFERLLAEGERLDQVVEIMLAEPHNVPQGELDTWSRDAELLKRVIERSNDLIGQAWGGMWRTIKEKAILGSPPHCKMLIEFVQESKRLPERELMLRFAEAVAGKGKNDD